LGVRGNSALNTFFLLKNDDKNEILNIFVNEKVNFNLKIPVASFGLILKNPPLFNKKQGWEK
jgi:hypothetical protein